jgi:hypothetical protein
LPLLLKKESTYPIQQRKQKTILNRKKKNDSILADIKNPEIIKSRALVELIIETWRSFLKARSDLSCSRHQSIAISYSSVLG